VVSLAYRAGAMASVSKPPIDRLCHARRGRHRGLPQHRVWGKGPCEQALADSTTLLRGMWEVTRPASQRGSGPYR
jgi:hypothetical protein